MTQRGKRISAAESLQVTRENPRNLKETERETCVLLQQREYSVGRASVCTSPLQFHPVFANTMKGKVRANPANNNTNRYESEFIHKRIFKTFFPTIQHNVFCEGVTQVQNFICCQGDM